MSENRALLDADRSGDAPGVLRCLDDGASIAWRDGKGCGALFHAVFQRQWAVVDTLLARGRHRLAGASRLVVVPALYLRFAIEDRQAEGLSLLGRKYPALRAANVTASVGTLQP